MPFIKKKRITLKTIAILLLSTASFFFQSAIGVAVPKISEINVVMDDNYPPYTFRDSDEALQGILVDQWMLWEKKTGVKVNLTAMDWNKALYAMEQKKFDVIDTVFETEARKQYLDFTEPYENIDVSIFFRNTVGGIVDVESLEGFVVGVKSGDAAIDYLYAHGIETLIEYESYEKLILAAKEGKVVTFVADELAIVYLLHRHNLNTEFNYTEPLYSGQFHRAVAKGNTEILKLVAEGFAQISPKEYNTIQAKWFGKSSGNFRRALKDFAGIGIVLAGIGVFLLAWNRNLKKAVRVKTYEIIQAVRKTEQINRSLKAIISAIPDVVFVINREGVILDILSDVRNKVLYKLNEDSIGHPIYKTLSPEVAQKYMDALALLFSGHGGQKLQYSLEIQGVQKHFEARLVFIEEDKALCIERENTEEKETQKKIYKMSIRDSVTGLFNRAFFEQETEKFVAKKKDKIGIIMCDIDGLKLINDTIGHLAGDRCLYAVGEILSSQMKEHGFVARIGGDEFAIVLPDSSVEEITEYVGKINEEVKKANEKKEDNIPISISIGYSLVGDGKEDLIAALTEADDFMYRDKLRHRQSVRSYSIDLLSKMLGERDFITEGHGERMQDSMKKFATALHFSPDAVNDLLLFAQFHDIGKVGISDTILYKNSSLSASEWDEMKRHSEIGFRIAKSSPDIKHISEWILKHHERWDGTGYPLGLKGTNIPLESRMLSIVDAFDAMTNDRPYHKARPYSEAFEELRKFAGIQFDPGLVEIFINIIK